MSEHRDEARLVNADTSAGTPWEGAEDVVPLFERMCSDYPDVPLYIQRRTVRIEFPHHAKDLVWPNS